MMKWAILSLWVSAILYLHFRSRIRLPWRRVFLDHSILLAPINAIMVLFSKVPTTPFISVSHFPELKILQDNWKTFREEALHLSQQQEIKAAANHDDIGFNSFFKYGWKRFYLKWYGARHPSANELCPKSVALLDSIPSVKAAMFAELPAQGKLNKHRDPYAGSIRFHMGLLTPNDDACYIEVDGERYSWRDGEMVMFDETYIHEAYNKTAQNRIILFCDIERPVNMRWVTFLNKWFSRIVMSAASSPNDRRDETGFINKMTYLHDKLEEKRRAFKHWNRTAYKLTKYSLITLLVIWFIWG
jgi:beta-hydroxylase